MPNHDLSVVGLFLAADPVVKGVMILLVLASVTCWAIVLEKTVVLARAKAQARRFEAAVAAGAGFDEAEAPGLAAAIVAAGRHEWQDHDVHETRAERRERIERALRTAMVEELRRLDTHLPVLATVGSSAPFVGLFGTVWGIMHSFTSIAASNDTSLAVVAPGIAEALFATAIGLVAAIPAVVAYNKLTSDLGRLSQRLSLAAGRLAGHAVRPHAAHLKAAE